MLRWLETGSRWIPLCFVAFFVTVVATDLVLVTIAVRTSPGLAETGAYAKGLAFNRELDAARESRALGWDASLEFAVAEPGPNRVRVAVRAPDGVPVTGAVATLTLVRPTAAGYDVAVDLVEAAPGIYEAPLTVPLPGLWQAEALIRKGGDRLQAARRLVLGS